MLTGPCISKRSSILVLTMIGVAWFYVDRCFNVMWPQSSINPVQLISILITNIYFSSLNLKKKFLDLLLDTFILFLYFPTCSWDFLFFSFSSMFLAFLFRYFFQVSLFLSSFSLKTSDVYVFPLEDTIFQDSLFSIMQFFPHQLPFYFYSRRHVSQSNVAASRRSLSNKTDLGTCYFRLAIRSDNMICWKVAATNAAVS